MKPSSLLSSIIPLLLFTSTAFPSPAVVLFSENFESGLGKWTGKTGLPHHGITVADPLGSGRGQVLTFTDFNTAGDMFSTESFRLPYQITISFDYLGLPMQGSVPDDLGGFFGISDGFPGAVLRWLAGTREAEFPDAFSLVDDGQWHRVSISLGGSTNGGFHLVLEDWLTSGGVAGDVFFDNIEVLAFPAPQVRIRTSEVELCFDTISNAWHQVQFRSALTANQWVPFMTNVFRGDGGTFCTRDPVAAGQPQRFYRVVLTDAPQF